MRIANEWKSGDQCGWNTWKWVVGQLGFLRASFVPFVSLWLVLRIHHKDTESTKEITEKTNLAIAVPSNSPILND